MLPLFPSVSSDHRPCISAAQKMFPLTPLFHLSDLRMHQSGVRMTNEVIRGDEVVHTAAVDVFQFDQQGIFPMVLFLFACWIL